MVSVFIHRHGIALRTDSEERRGTLDWPAPADLTIDPGTNPLTAVAQTLQALHTDPAGGLPPLTSGLVGYMGYDMVRYIEDLPDTCEDDLNVPDMVQLLVEDMAVVDHHEGAVWLIANVINWDNSDARVDEAYDEAIARIDAMTSRLAAGQARGVDTFRRPSPPHVGSAARTTTSTGLRSVRNTSGLGMLFRLCYPSGSRWILRYLH